VNVGDFESLNGVYDLLYNPRTITTKDTASVHSYCMAGVPVCHFSAENLAFCFAIPRVCPHVNYADYGWSQTAGRWLASRVKR
jgi:hypothetical protein